jgi:hypothetical protein
MKWAVVVIALAACGPRSPHDVTAAFISAVDHMEVDAAKKLVVSPEQVAQLIECTGKTTWYTRADRAERVAQRLASYAHHDPTSERVALGDLWEEYDNPAQWHAYKPGDVIGGPDCHAKAAFDVQVYRIELHIEEMSRVKTSTKPIELWRIDGSWFVWDDPMDTEGW